MTLQDRTEQNKRCWLRITELHQEIDDITELLVENMIQIAEDKNQELQE